MSGEWTRSLMALAGVALCMLAAACTGSDPIVSGNGNVAVRVEPSPSGSARYDRVNLGVATIQVRPDDPVVQAELGSLTIPHNVTPFSGDLAAGSFQSSGVPLTRGTYRIVRLELTRPTLVDSNPPSPPATCLENLGSVPDVNSEFLVPPTFIIEEADIDASLSVPAASSTVVTVSVDIPALVTAYESAFTCQAPCPNAVDPACITSFDTGGFASQLAGLVTVR